jgi:hypothetical protein
MPIYGPEFIGPLPTGAIQLGEGGSLFIVLHRPAPKAWWALAHGLPIKEESA